MNDIGFWNNYNETLKTKIENLISEKEKIKIDLHMHTTYSTDGKQTLKQLLEHMKELKFDVISITDHDNIEVYDELYELIKNGEIEKNNYPLIIPGVEFTVKCRDYGSQCHILQYYINPKEETILKDIERNELAGWERTRKQFIRMQENKTLQYFCKNYNIQFSLEEYKKYLIETKLMVPDYATLIEYIKEKLLEKKIDVLQVFDKLEEDNMKDNCEERKNAKINKFIYLRNKHNNQEIAKTSSRLLLSILAVKGVDDDYYPEYESSGSLSVNEYNQITIEDLNRKYLTIFAHPNASGFDVIENIEKYNSEIVGIEDNIRSEYTEEQHKEFYKIAKEKDYIVTLGSDSHDNTNTFYNNLDFYFTDKINLLKLNRR